jgi:hypothetical protein
LIDGGEAQNLLLGVPILIFDPPVESVQEFNVAVSDYAAELGRTGCAVACCIGSHGYLSEPFLHPQLITHTMLQQSEIASGITKATSAICSSCGM